MINLIANEKLKNLGCKWDGTRWIPPKLAKKEYTEILETFYSDLVTIEVHLTPGNKFQGKEWAQRHVLTIGGYIIAYAKGRDSGAKIEDISVIRGSFRSGGSVKNYMCTHTDDVILRMEVSRNALHYLDSERSKWGGRYTYIIMEDSEPDLNDLLTKKQSLIDELNEVEAKIKASQSYTGVK